MSSPITYLYLAALVVSVVFATLLSVATEPDKVRAHRVAIYVLIALWALCDLLSNLAQTAREVELLAYHFAPVWTAVPFALLWGVLRYTETVPRRTERWLVPLLAAPALGCTGLVWSGVLYHEFLPAAVNGLFFESRATGWQAVVNVYILGYVLAASVVAVIAARRRGGHSMLRATGRVLLTAVVPVAGVATLVNGGLSPLGLDLPYVGSVAAATVASAVGFGMLRHMYFAPLDEARRERDEARQLLSQQEELHEASKMEAIGRLAAGVAHDFNNQLSTVLGNAAFLEEVIGPDHESREDLEEIQRAGERARVLIRQLLAFSRGPSPHEEVVEVNEVVVELGRTLGLLLGGEVELAILPAASPVYARAHRAGLEQVLMTLAQNAREAMPEGGRLTIAVLQPVADDDADREVAIRVRDTGHGMTEEVRRRAFEPFYTTKGVGGTGLGLTTAYALVTGSGGRLELASAEGKGATFTIRYARTTGDAPRPSPVPDTAAGSPSPLNESIRALLVDDNGAVRRTMCRCLERAGIAVEAADGGEAALELFDSAPERFDVLVTDLLMPGLDGGRLARKIRQRAPDLPIVVVSGHPGVTTPPASGPTRHVGKPFRPETLVMTIEELLEEAKSSEGGGAR